jgi:hypothetical protein
MDPSAILDPTRGIPAADQGHRRDVRGQGERRGPDRRDPARRRRQGPGVNTQTDIKGKVWIAETDNRLTKVMMTLPAARSR